MIRFKRCDLGVSQSVGCALCSGGKAIPLSLPDIQANIENLLDSDPENGDLGVLIGGLEPFMYPQLPEVISLLVLKGFKRVALQTDGGALANPQAAAGCIASGVRTFVIQLRGVDASMHDRLSHAPGLFRAMEQGIAAVRQIASDQNYSVAIIMQIELCPHNHTQLGELVRAALVLGPDAIELVNTTNHEFDPNIMALAHAASTSAGAYLFGDGCDQFLGGQRLYEIVG